MAEIIRVKDQHNQDVVVQEGESFDLVATFKDLADPPVQLTKADIVDIKLMLYRGTTIINNRNNVSVRDANGGSLSTAGVLTLKLDPADQAIVDATLSDGAVESHVARLTWTWNDGRDRTGIAEYQFDVEKLSAPE